MDNLNEQDPALLQKFPHAHQVREFMEAHSPTPMLKAAFTAIKRAAKKGNYVCQVFGKGRTDDFGVQFLRERGYEVVVYETGPMFISWKVAQ